MAKKKETLSPEQRLQAALVTENEQPYKVPENWCWVYWGACGDFQAGSGFKNEYQGLTEYSIPFYKVGSLKYSDSSGILYDTSNTVSEEIRKKLKASLIPENSIIFAKIGEAIRLNRRSINPVACCIDNNLMSFCAQACSTKYAYFWSLGIDLYNYTNATTVPAIRKSDLEKITFPLAPSAEQQRIVDRIESLFAQLDEAKERAQAALDSFEPRKAAILHKAFTGELTAQWRQEHGVGMESWANTPLNQVCLPRAGYAFDSKLFSNFGYQIIRMGNLFAGELNLSRNPVFYAEENLDAKILKRALVNDGDILLTLTGTKYKRDYGYAVRIEKPHQLLVNQRILCLTPLSINPSYLLYFLKSDIFRDVFFSNETGGVNQGNVSSKFVENILIPVSGDAEQKEIATILRNLLAKEQQAKEAAEAVLEQIDLIKKSILSRAFRGELGTNNPNEENSIELLKEIITKEA